MYRDGTNLILSLAKGNAQVALGHSTECKISYKADTGTRKTKEAASGKWEEKYVKTNSVTITASGFVNDSDEAAGKLGISDLEDAFISAQPVKASWNYRGEEANGPHYHECMVVITQLEQNGPAGDDETYSITLENSGAVTKGANGSSNDGNTVVEG